MSEAKRYTVTRERTVFDTVSVIHVAECASKFDAQRIARLLNAEEAVRAALEEAESWIMWSGEPGEPQPSAMAKVRAALSALDAEAVRP